MRNHLLNPATRYLHAVENVEPAMCSMPPNTRLNADAVEGCQYFEVEHFTAAQWRSNEPDAHAPFQQRRRAARIIVLEPQADCVNTRVLGARFELLALSLASEIGEQVECGVHAHGAPQKSTALAFLEASVTVTWSVEAWQESSAASKCMSRHSPRMSLFDMVRARFGAYSWKSASSMSFGVVASVG
ncbi:hypothetical protein BAUCODRAFT_303627 [Baudoinia panamericana UAMH 10762]|uniref:Uncharacterized protein n=1 Tax=Baudoinia panamericana (strain UAMH 10762) TaxID=717646 RepID=M2LCR4_BAUPA|nr:uncharacterized protein BAUCODRAFT_303627 [Baudoinia panamericana UAMH 10762]EMC91762.1 hypothetical protein BAUCODRAFT_303627 [Baudoinia panamericana UAMH 10762]